MMRNLLSLVRTDVGIETSGLLQTAFDLRRRDYDSERRFVLLGQLEERLASGATIDAALASHAPMAGASVRRLRVDGQPASEPGALPSVSLIHVGQRYFDVVGSPLLAGRAFASAEIRQPGDSVVVNERFARMYFSRTRHRSASAFS